MTRFRSHFLVLILSLLGSCSNSSSRYTDVFSNGEKTFRDGANLALDAERGDGGIPDICPGEPPGKGGHDQRPEGADAGRLDRCGDAGKNDAQDQEDQENRRDNASEQKDFLLQTYPFLLGNSRPEARIYITSGGDVKDIHARE